MMSLAASSRGGVISPSISQPRRVSLSLGSAKLPLCAKSRAGCSSIWRAGSTTTPIRTRSAICKGLGDDAVGGFFDLAKLVSASGTSKSSAFEELAYKIGQDVYADFGGWHLYLRDMKGTPDLKMAQVVANAIGAKMSSNGFDERDVEDLLKGIPVTLGGGKIKVSLLQAMPSYCVQDL